MALLERVTTLLRANLNDLIDKAEDPEKMIKQVILDMQNQLMQVKTQVAVALTDEHLLLKKKQEHEQKAADWTRKAELAVDKGQDDLASAALERSLSYQQMAGNFDQQVTDQKQQVEMLKSALSKLEAKLVEAESRRDVLIAQHRRARAVNRASDARAAIKAPSAGATFDRMADKVRRSEAIGEAKTQLLEDDFDARLEKLEKEDHLNRLLADLKTRRAGG